MNTREAGAAAIAAPRSTETRVQIRTARAGRRRRRAARSGGAWYL